MSKKSIIKGTLILTATGLCTKLLGFYYRIFLTRLIGVQELGIYQLVFPIYILMFSFVSQGFCQALTKHVSHYLGNKKQACIKHVFHFALSLSLFLSILVAVLVYINSKNIACFVLKNSQCASLIRLLCIAIPFVALKAMINAYFMGNEQPKYQGVTQLFEQIIRIFSAYILSTVCFIGQRNSKLAVIAVVIGELGATLLSVFFYYYVSKNTGNDNSKKNLTSADCTVSMNKIHTSYIKDALPMTTNNLIFSIFASFEAILMPTMLFYFYHDKTLTMELFGIVNGIVLPFILFPATITTSLSSMLLPTVSYASAEHNYKKIKKTLMGSVFFCLTLGMFAWFIYRILGVFICNFAFHNKDAGLLLANMSFLCPCIYLSGTLSAILNGMSMALSNLVYNLIGISIRIACSIFFVPSYGIKAYVFSLACSYLVIDILQYITINKTNQHHFTADTVLPDKHNN
ncbi:MAG: oligosaccharide flippase family protein [Eubacteriales bacterium]|nr:oligosaccharide flippase family protein [Lachnospiraceae bacterium]MDO5127733.1 oligosaccharide flippase family protein [Eubacteriales bacterium]